VTLPTFAAERRRMPHGARSAPAAIDRSISPAARRVLSSKPPLLLSIDVTDGRADGRTPNRYIDPAPHMPTMPAA